MPPRKPEKSGGVKAEKPARPPARKPEVTLVNMTRRPKRGLISAGGSAGSRRAAAVGRFSRSIPRQDWSAAHPDLSQMQFKIQEIHFNPGSAN